MTVEETRNCKAALEARLLRAAAEVVDEFQRNTGLKVDGVSIDLTDIQRIEERAARSLVCGARLDVRL